MSRILFWVWNETGHVNPALSLAHRLRAAGHDVQFIASESSGELLSEHGFAYHEPHFNAFSGPSGKHSSIGDVIAFVRRLNADLILCDHINSFEESIAHAAGARTAMYSTMLPSWKDAVGPPLYTNLAEGQNLLARVRIRMWWLINGLRQWYRLQRDSRTGTISSEALTFFKEYCTERGLVHDTICWNTCLNPPLPRLLTVPVLVMSIPELDFYRQDTASLDWIGPCILRKRRSDMVPQSNGKGPLVFVGLGSQIHTNPWAKRFFEIALDVFSRRDDWRAVFAVGPQLLPYLSSRQFGTNVTVSAYVDQMQVLRDSDVAVLHGGHNSLVEALSFGLPLALFPSGNDQLGNATRLVSRGVALRDRGWKVTSERLENMIEELLTVPSYRAAAIEMQVRFAALEAGHHAVRIVESLCGADSGVTRGTEPAESAQ